MMISRRQNENQLYKPKKTHYNKHVFKKVRVY